MVRILSAAAQVTAQLREELISHQRIGFMPGAKSLAAELGVNHKTAATALRQLVEEGLIEAQGSSLRRKIVVEPSPLRRVFRVALLDYESRDLTPSYFVELQHLLTEAGHCAFFADKRLLELGMDVKRIARMVKATEADAWVILSASRDVLAWFAAQSQPAFALFGRRRDVPIAGCGPDKPAAFAAATRRLIQLGHRRIVMLTRGTSWPRPGASERAVLAELAAHGVRPDRYHLPDWVDTAEGFRRCLESLFEVTPPTALILDLPEFVISSHQFLTNRGMSVPGDVSLICSDHHPHFEWCLPTVAHIRWDSRPVLRRIMRWVENVSQGKPDRRQISTSAQFIEGGTIGPVKD